MKLLIVAFVLITILVLRTGVAELVNKAYQEFPSFIHRLKALRKDEKEQQR